MNMSMVMQCPFFKMNETLKWRCEGGELKFPDAISRREYIIEFCANEIRWEKCTICKNLEKYYERKDSE